jgi:Tol biopolymer transport system component
MSDLSTLVREVMDQAGVPSYSFDDLARRRDHKRSNQRILAAAVAIAVAVVSFATLVRALRTVEAPADHGVPTPSSPPSPPPPSTPLGIFANVRGWIAWGDNEGIWALNPAGPTDEQAQVQLSDRGGDPLAWSSDGTKLLVWRHWPSTSSRGSSVLLILNADGTETVLTKSREGSFQEALQDYVQGASLSPDGSQVVFAKIFENPSTIDLVDASGGTPRVLLTGQARAFPGETGRYPSMLYAPAFSPDGSRVAYFDGMGDWGHGIRVMNADGSGVHEVVPSNGAISCNHIHHLVWSPDGSRLAFDCEEGGIWLVNPDGSGLAEVIPDGINPYWSPDGSQIAYEAVTGPWQTGPLRIANPDGTHVREFDIGGSGPWNPLEPAG